jgi:hypothetical protein
METQKLNLEKMENIEGGGHLRDCLIDGAVATIGAATILFGGYTLAVGGIADAARRGCFD